MQGRTQSNEMKQRDFSVFHFRHVPSQVPGISWNSYVYESDVIVLFGLPSFASEEVYLSEIEIRTCKIMSTGRQN